ncbi:hypothetical protein LINGRAHAP2_LOCUS22914, partial [Linum grandiflorum]
MSSSDRERQPTESSNPESVPRDSPVPLYHYRLRIRDTEGKTDVVEFKFAEHMKVLEGGKKIVMELQDDGDRPIGDLLSFFGSYTGECSRNYGYYPISADSWDKMPMAFKDRAWDALAL